MLEDVEVVEVVDVVEVLPIHSCVRERESVRKITPSAVLCCGWSCREEVLVGEDQPVVEHVVHEVGEVEELAEHVVHVVHDVVVHDVAASNPVPKVEVVEVPGPHTRPQSTSGGSRHIPGRVLASTGVVVAFTEGDSEGGLHIGVLGFVLLAPLPADPAFRSSSFPSSSTWRVSAELPEVEGLGLLDRLLARLLASSSAEEEACSSGLPTSVASSSVDPRMLVVELAWNSGEASCSRL